MPGPITQLFIDNLSNGFESFIIDLITVSPILAGVSIGVYALIGMVSKTLAKFGVAGVFLYGALIIVI